MICFFFAKVDRARLKEREYEFAAKHLGADVVYTGRPIDVAHAPHPIMGGQFMRRLRLLEETLEEYAVPAHVRAHWVEHTKSLRPLVTRDAGDDCDAEEARARVAEHFRSLRTRDEEGR
jgi:hemoglobin